MLTLIGSLIGFGTGFMPKILAFFEEKQSHKHELERMRLSAELASQQHKMDMLALNLKADIEQSKGLYRHDASFKQASPWVDNVRALVRPVLTFSSLLLYGGLLCFGDAALLASTAFAGLEAMTASVWAFWFGNRAIKM